MEFLVLWIGFAVVAAIAASSRGRSGDAWFFLGLVFGIFALIAVLVMPRVEPETTGSAARVPNETTRRAELRQAAEAERRAAAAAAAADSMPCPRCAETIKKAATMCRFCQLDIEAWQAEKASAT